MDKCSCQKEKQRLIAASLSDSGQSWGLVQRIAHLFLLLRGLSTSTRMRNMQKNDQELSFRGWAEGVIFSESLESGQLFERQSSPVRLIQHSLHLQIVSGGSFALPHINFAGRFTIGFLFFDVFGCYNSYI